MESKTSKYFKYAIGEIVLVVIGILIALQINNWNENRKLKLNEKAVLESLIEDLEIDYEHFQINKIHLENQLLVIDQLISDPFNSKSETLDLNYLRYNTDLFPISFEDNIPKDIYNKDIIESIKTYYRDQETIMNTKETYTNVVLEMVRPFLTKHGIHNPNTAINFDYKSTNNKKLLVESKLSKHYGSDEFEQILFELRLKAGEYLNDLDNLLLANKNLIPVLKEYIND